MKGRAVIIISRKRNLLVMRRQGLGQVCASLPGGKVERGETARQACFRDVREEMGLNVTVDRQVAASRNDGRMEYCVLAGRWEGVPLLGGEELDRLGPDNRYALDWADVDRLDEINLMPPAIRSNCKGLATMATKRAE